MFKRKFKIGRKLSRKLILTVKENQEIMVVIKDLSEIKATPYDPRFPNTNQTRHCYQSYLDYHRCVKKRGEGYEACQYFLRAYRDLCPKFWIEKWDAEREADIFPGDI